MALDGKGTTVVVVLFVEAFASGLFIGLRWFTRRFVRGDVGADDYVLWATWVSATQAIVGRVILGISGLPAHMAVEVYVWMKLTGNCPRSFYFSSRSSS